MADSVSGQLESTQAKSFVAQFVLHMTIILVKKLFQALESLRHNASAFWKTVGFIAETEWSIGAPGVRKSLLIKILRSINSGTRRLPAVTRRTADVAMVGTFTNCGSCSSLGCNAVHQGADYRPAQDNSIGVGLTDRDGGKKIAVQHL